MDWINYHHLLYFWMVAKEGGIARACEKLHLSQPTISMQLKQLETSLGEKLFAKSGRGLVLTEVGQTVYRYADEIFSLGREMMDTVKGRPTGRPLRLVVGISDSMPKLVVHQLLAPALKLPEKVQLVCYEDSTDKLLTELSASGLDLLLTDAPIAHNVRVKAFNHLLGESSLSVFGAKELAAKHRKEFPKSLDGAPLLMPMTKGAVRRAIDHWLEQSKLRPLIVGEFQDSALAKVFGANGAGLFFGPTVIQEQICHQYGVSLLGEIEAVRERVYAVSVERRLKHPAVVAISEAAKSQLFV
jgi:LysR family transcriptional activator of nhaA